VHVPEEAWDQAKVPDHLRPTFRVLDEQGAELGVGKDLEALKQPLRPSFDRAIRQVADESGVSATGQTAWTFGTIEPSFTRTRAGHEVHGFPTLVDEGSTVGLRVAASAEEQEANHRLGVRRLLLLALPSPVGQMVESLDNHAKLALAASPYPNVRALVEDCVTAAAGELVDSREPVRDPEAFAALVERARATLGDAATGVLHQVIRVLDEWRSLEKSLHGRVEMLMLPAMTDLRAQIARLVHPGFIAEAGSPALREYPRYLKAMAARVERLPDRARDRELMDRIDVLQQAWQHRVDALPEGRPLGADLRRVRWMLEEYRVSLWAQNLGTAQPVSDARIRKALG
jgi:ATP-dependent helicase HrpA